MIAQLPISLLRPVDLLTAAVAHLPHTKAVLGPVEVSGLTELEPCWRSAATGARWPRCP